MRYFATTSLVLCLMINLGGNSTQAQEGLRGPGGAIGGFHLIAMPAIQQELGLSESQVEKSKTVAQRMNSRFEQDMGKLRGLNDDQKMKRVVTLADPHYQQGMDELSGFLKPDQLDRFDQILFQQRGPMAILEPRIVETLQITNEQAQKVAQLVAQAENEQNQVVKSEEKGSKNAMVKVEAVAADANAKVYDILSPEQKRKWSRIVGKPFRPDLGGGNAGGNKQTTQPAPRQ